MELIKRIHWRWKFGGAIDAQLRNSTPIEVRQAYDRLRASGLSHRRARGLLVSAIEAETASMLIEGRPFEIESYARFLAALPTRPPVSLDDWPVAPADERTGR